MLPRLSSLKFPRWAAGALALLGLALYLAQAWVYIHTNIPGLDEGAYLYKGYLFATGEYNPFGPGILTNKAPLAFLIPGYLQRLFGAGLLTGRLYAFGAGLLAVLGTYFAARRMVNAWLAAATVWVFALSPMMIKIYSGAVTQGLIAALLAWMLLLVLGADRRPWHLIAGASLAAVMVLVRQNMAPVLVLLLLYMLWEHGWAATWKAALAAGVVLVIAHAAYWPNILQMWAPWLPQAWTPFLDAFRLPADVVPSWDPSVDWLSRLGAFFEGLRHHLIVVTASLFALVTLRVPSGWRSDAGFRRRLFLLVLYFGLFVLHAWGAVGSNYEFFSCIYCFTPYLGFFAPAGILLGVATLRHWKEAGARLSSFVAALVVILLLGGVGFSAFEDLGGPILDLPFPRLREGGIVPGWTTLEAVAIGLTGIKLALARKLAALGAGLLAGVLALAAAWLLWRKVGPAARGYASVLGTTTLVLSLALTPILGGRASRPDCATDVIALNEEVGYHLSGLIPVGSSIYWDGGLSVVPMLYLPGRSMYGPQINSGYTFVRGGDPDTLLRLGYWNEALSAKWFAEADFVIVEMERYPGWKQSLAPDRFGEYTRTPVGTSCLPGTQLRIFKRLGPEPALL